MKQRLCDVCIIGAGPAGLVAAQHLSNYGLTYVLLEAQSMPRQKPCADIITSKAIREIDLAFPNSIAQMTQNGLLNPIIGTQLKVNEKAAIDIPFKPMKEDGRPSCYAVSRTTLDEFLWNKLKSNELSVHQDNSRVIAHNRIGQLHEVVLENGDLVHSKACIIATGSNKNSFINSDNKKEGALHTAIGIRAYFKGLKLSPQDQCHLFLKDQWMPGGLYIAPLNDDLYNVNMVIRKDKVQKSNINLKEVFKQTIYEHRELKDIFEHSEMIGAIQGSALKLATTKRKLSSNGAFLTGDSAGLIDLISANGIPQAMISGRLAAKAALGLLDGVKEEQVIRNYSSDLSLAIQSDVALGKRLAPFLSFPWVNSLILSGISQISNRTISGEDGIERFLYSKYPVKELASSLNPFSKGKGKSSEDFE